MFDSGDCVQGKQEAVEAFTVTMKARPGFTGYTLHQNLCH
jgi:hypothetical protein